MTWGRPATGSPGSPPGWSRSASSREQRVGIASGTRYEWILADLAIMCAGAATTTVYPSTITDDVAYILADSECRDRVRRGRRPDRQAARGARPSCRCVDQGRHLRRARRDGDWVIRLADLEKLGEELLAERARTSSRSASTRTTGDSLATLIYTSGTTGRPKGVRLRHASWTYEGAAIEALDILAEDDLQFLWLPMAHSFGKVLLSTQLASASPPRSTAASTRSSTTSRS